MERSNWALSLSLELNVWGSLWKSEGHRPALSTFELRRRLTASVMLSMPPEHGLRSLDAWQALIFRLPRQRGRLRSRIPQIFCLRICR